MRLADLYPLNPSPSFSESSIIIEITMIYPHLADEHVDKAVENLKF